mmetsp:Transcript_29049/g.68890  ORF Transcript_29049/g.68890 Transcript_29049/m.68890 type:complete len:310 (+) Transcript_29049:954-1883(+)
MQALVREDLDVAHLQLLLGARAEDEDELALGRRRTQRLQHPGAHRLHRARLERRRDFASDRRVRHLLALGVGDGDEVVGGDAHLEVGGCAGAEEADRADQPLLPEPHAHPLRLRVSHRIRGLHARAAVLVHREQCRRVVVLVEGRLCDAAGLVGGQRAATRLHEVAHGREGLRLGHVASTEERRRARLACTPLCNARCAWCELHGAVEPARRSARLLVRTPARTVERGRTRHALCRRVSTLASGAGAWGPALRAVEPFLNDAADVEPVSAVVPHRTHSARAIRRNRARCRLVTAFRTRPSAALAAPRRI